MRGCGRRGRTSWRASFDDHEVRSSRFEVRMKKSSSSFFIRTSNFELLLAAAAASFTNFLYYALTSRDYLFPDSLTYLVPARNLLRGLGFVDVVGAAATLRTPGYPLLPAAFGGPIPWVI